MKLFKIPFVILLILLIFMTIAQVRAENVEIQTPAQLVLCMKSYIGSWMVGAQRIGHWEHAPAFEFAGKYVFASWTTEARSNYGSLGLMVGQKDLIYCDYPLNENERPEKKKGFCVANVETGDVTFDSIIFVKGKPVQSEQKVAVIRDSKIYCLSLTHP